MGVAFRVIFLTALLTFSFAKERNSLFTSILKDYVKNGIIDFTSLKNDTRLEEYLTYLAGTNPEKFENKNDKLAFYINAYNAYTLKIIVDNFPIESINDLHFGGLILGSVLKTTVWDKDFVIINKTEINLNYLKDEIIRAKFKNPLIHFALINASKSSPVLRPEAYEGDKIDKQLDEQTKIFINDKKKNHFDVPEKTAWLSEIFNWYRSDFGESDAEILKFISPYLKPQVKKVVLSSIPKWKIKHLEFDWTLNI